jgi:DNA-directed RNA polymerase specialized sigma subunit
MTGISENVIPQRLEISKVKAITSLDALVNQGEGGGTALVDLIQGESANENWEDSIQAGIDRAWLDSQLELLSEPEQAVLQGIREGRSHKAIGAELGLSHSRCGQHRASAIRKLRIAAVAA